MINLKLISIYISSLLPVFVSLVDYLVLNKLVLNFLLPYCMVLNLTPPLTSCCALLKTRQQCFSDASTRRPADLLSTFTTIKTVMNSLYDGLVEVLLILLKSTDTRENVLEYLAEVINKNASRSHIQVISAVYCI